MYKFTVVIDKIFPSFRIGRTGYSLDGCNVYVLRVGWRYLKVGHRWGPIWFTLKILLHVAVVNLSYCVADCPSEKPGTYWCTKIYSEVL